MSNLQLFDPHLAQKLERKQNTKYLLLVESRKGTLSGLYEHETIQDVKATWIKAEVAGWRHWLLYKRDKLIAQGKFYNEN